MKILMLFGVMLGGLIGASGVAWSTQDPVKQDPVRVEEADKTKTDRAKKDRLAAAREGPRRDPIEGVYRLLSRTVNGAPDLNVVRGYIAVTRRHMLLCLAAAGPDPDYPLLRAGVREWHRNKEGFDTVVQIGFYTDDDGDVHVEDPGTAQVRRIDVIRGKLRIWQDGESYLEFERLE